VRELEHELEAEQHRHVETQKGLRKQDRRLQEVNLQIDEDHKAQERMKDMIDKLQQKMKAYKKQVDEAVGGDTCICLLSNVTIVHIYIAFTPLNFRDFVGLKSRTTYNFVSIFAFYDVIRAILEAEQTNAEVLSVTLASSSDIVMGMHALQSYIPRLNGPSTNIHL
jgi:uncharacterized coiled-coil protein SlyX